MNEQALRIVFDLRPLQSSSAYRGIGVYIRNLLYHISLIDCKNHYFLMHYQNMPELTVKIDPGFSFEFFPVKSLPVKLSRFNIFYEFFFLEEMVKKIMPDVVHFTSPMELNQHFHIGKMNPRVVASFYDITPYLFKDLIFRGRRAFLWYIYTKLLNCLKNVKRIVCLSENSCNDLKKIMKIPDEKVTFAYPGPPEELDDDKEIAAHENSNIIDGFPFAGKDFLLYVGGAPRQKNVDMIVEILPQLREKIEKEIHFVLVGNLHDEDRNRLILLAKSLKVEQFLHFTGFLSTKCVKEIYRRCRCVVFPSLYEGFGFPALEAMQAGSPLIASSVSSILEVVGDAGILVDPKKPEDWIESIVKVLTDKQLSNELVEKGNKRLNNFKWEKTAEKVLEIYNEFGKT